MKRSRISFFILVLFTLQSIACLSFPIQEASALASNELPAFSTLVTARAYKWNSNLLGDSRTYNKLKFDVGGITFYTRGGAKIIEMGPQNTDPDERLYWYRIPMMMSYNAYTVLTRYDAVKSGSGAYESQKEVTMATIRTRANWNQDWSSPTTYSMKLPDWKIAGHELGAPRQKSDAFAYISDNYKYSGVFYIKLSLRPDLGFPDYIENGKFKSSYTAIRLTGVKTLNDGTASNWEYGEIPNGSNTYIDTGVGVADMSGGNTQPSSDSSGAPSSQQGDLVMSGFEWSAKGYKSLYMPNPPANLPAVVQPESKGVEINPINFYTNNVMDYIPTDFPAQNMTEWLIPISTTIQPKLEIWEGSWTINEYSADLDTVDEIGVFGDAGIRYQSTVERKYTTINAWKVTNAYVHQEIGFYVDVAVKYKLVPTPAGLDGDTNPLGKPAEYVSNEVWSAFVQGEEKIAIEVPNNDVINLDNLIPKLDTNQIIKVITLVIVGIVAVAIIVISIQFGGGARRRRPRYDDYYYDDYQRPPPRRRPPPRDPYYDDRRTTRLEDNEESLQRELERIEKRREELQKKKTTMKEDKEREEKQSKNN